MSSSSISSLVSSSRSSSSSSSKSSASSRSVPANAHLVTINNAQNSPSTGLACNQANAPASCDLRMYQIMVEAFIDADANANYNLAYGNSHHKGDLQGIINSLDYIESLGVNTIWLTPIFLSQPNPNQDDWATRLDGTGYFASNYFAVDPKFGTSAQLHELVSKAHAKGLYVLLDGVFGHFKGNARDFASPSNRRVTQSNGSAVYPQDLEFFKEVATYWIKEYKIDGWRLDQAYQVPIGYWDDIRASVEAASAETTYINKDGQSVNPLGYMVAEIWRGEGEIASQGYGPANAPGLKSAFDFPMRYKLVQTLAIEESGVGKTGATNLNAGFNTHLTYPAHAQPNLMLTNHDLVRFGDLLQRGGIANPSDDEYWLRHKAAFGFMTAFSGPITIYYGDEIGEEFPNYAAKVCDAAVGTCDDHVSRTSAKIEGLPPRIGAPITVLNSRQADLKAYVTEMMKLRAASPALSKGRRTHIFSDTNIYIDRKDHASGNMLYIANTKAAPAVITLAGNAIGSQADLVNPLTNDVYINSGGNFTIQLAPFESLFLYMDGAIVDIPDDEPVGDAALIGEGSLADCARPIVAGTGPLGKDMFIRGNYTGGNNFGATPANRKFVYTGNNIYQVKVDEPSATSYSFKFASSNWSSEFAVAGSAPVNIASTQPMAVASGAGTESLISIPKAGTYVFSFEINGTLNGGNMMVSLCP